MEPDRSRSTPSRTRRSLIQAVGATLATGTLGTVAGRAADEGVAGRVSDVPAYGRDPREATTAAARRQYVPSGVTTVATLDAGSLLADEAVQAAMDVEFGRGAAAGGTTGGAGVVPSTMQEARDGLDALTAVSLDAIDGAVVMGWLPGPDGGLEHATMFWADWQRADVVQSMESVLGLDLQKTGDQGYPRYRPQGDLADSPSTRLVSEFAFVDEGVYVIGSPGGVGAVVDRVAGAADPMDEPLAETFESLPDGPAQFAMDVPQRQFLEAAFRLPDQTLRTLALAMAGLSTAGTTMSIDGDRRRLAGYADAGSWGRAVQFATIVRLLTRENRPRFLSGLPTIPGDATVERSGTTVTADLSLTVSEVEDLTAAVAGVVPAMALRDPFGFAGSVATLLGVDVESGGGAGRRPN